MNNPFNAEPDVSSEDIVRALLEIANIQEPPTNAERIAKSLELTIRVFDEAKLNSKVLAYLWPEQKEIGISPTLPPRRKTFSILHEIAHYVLPGHVAQLDNDRFEDTSENFGSSSRKISSLEREANQFAADCLFQLDSFDQKILNSTLTWTNVLLLADQYLASYEATARRWVERTIQECALVALKPVTREPIAADLEIMYTITSRPFRERYFSSLTPGQTIGKDSLAYRVFNHLEYSENPEEELIVQSPISTMKFRMMLFSNSYRMFGLLTPTE